MDMSEPNTQGGKEPKEISNKYLTLLSDTHSNTCVIIRAEKSALFVYKERLMIREKIITFRVSENERLMIQRLVQILRRNQSDTIRFVMFQTLKRMENDPNYLCQETVIKRDRSGKSQNLHGSIKNIRKGI